jgi:hypothetical protein
MANEYTSHFSEYASPRSISGAMNAGVLCDRQCTREHTKRTHRTHHQQQRAQHAPDARHVRRAVLDRPRHAKVANLWHIGACQQTVAGLVRRHDNITVGE